MIKHIKKILIAAIGASFLMSMMLAGSVFGEADVIGGGSLVPESSETGKDTESEIVGPEGEFPGLPQEFSVIGDLDGNGKVESDDAIYLLMHTLFSESYPLNQDGDFNKDGTVDSDDSIYLLMHTLFPKDYPIEEGEYFPEET